MAAGVGTKRSRDEAETGRDGDATGKDNDSAEQGPSLNDAGAGSSKKNDAEEAVFTPATEKTCVHEVAIPPGYADSLDESVYGTIHNPVYTGEMAREYPFTLDPFQQMSVACIERRESVLVAAHTSAGKTAVAEYAVALAFKRKQRVIYTSPLKVRVRHQQCLLPSKPVCWHWLPVEVFSRGEELGLLPSALEPKTAAQSAAVQHCACNK